jgi:hypothetical protein
MIDRTWVVVPFERIGSHLGPRKALVCAAPEQAKAVAQQLAPTVPGLAIIERAIDPETGDDLDTVVAEVGAIPPGFPQASSWTVRLN